MRCDGDQVSEEPRFSFARLAIFSMGAGALVLAVSIPVIYGVSLASSPAALVVAVLAVALAVVVMGIVANRVVDTAVATEGDSDDEPPPPDLGGGMTQQ